MKASAPLHPRIALKIDVCTYRAALVGMPHLVELLRRNRATASFAVAFGPDNSGRTLTQPFGAARQGRATASTLASHYGFASLFYGSFLPAPHIGRRCAEILRTTQDAGFEIGLAGWDALAWTDAALGGDADWSRPPLEKARTAYEQVFSSAPKLHTAPGWRSNPHALRLTQRLGFTHASDCRGRHPFVPVWNGEIIRCPQFPTTLPTIDELADRAEPDLVSIRDQLLALTAKPAPYGHVFSLRPPHAPGKTDEFLEQLFAGWREQGYELTSIQALASAYDMDKLPRHEVVIGTVPGRCGSLLMQGEEFLSEWRQAA